MQAPLQKQLHETKDYLEYAEDPTGRTVIKLFMPPFEIESIQKQMLQQFTIPISAKERAQM